MFKNTICSQISGLFGTAGDFRISKVLISLWKAAGGHNEVRLFRASGVISSQILLV